MAKQLNVSLGFTADTSQAKAQLQDLQKQLQSLTSGAMGKASLSGGMTKEIQQAVSAATQLKVQLENATNVNTGKLDLGKFSESLDKSGMKLSDYRMQLEKLGPQGAQAFMSLATSISNAEVPMRRTNSLVKEFATTLKNTARWQLSSSMLNGFMGTLQSAYGYAQDLNESLNNIRIVTGQTTEQMDAFAIKANKAAKALSTSTTAYTDAALIFYQQGLDDKTVEERTNVTIKMAHAAGESATEVSSYMTAIWNNFDDGSKSLEYYGDVMARLGAKTAASSAEIAEGLEKFAAIGETVGLSYEYATSAVATVVDKTRQSADTVGTAFKTIFSRLQGLQLGEVLEDGTDLNKYSSALMSVGISIKDANGELKDMDIILDEMGAKWQTLHRDEQMALAQTVAGVRQYTQLMSLMNNYDFFKENVSTAETSSGTLQEQADIYAESWEAAQERVGAAAERLYSQLLDDDFFITMLNGFEKVLTGVGNLVDGLGGLKGVLFAVSAIMTKLFQNEIAKGLNNMAYNISMMTEKGRNKVTQKKEDSWNETSKLTAKDGTTVGDAQHTNIQQTSELQKLMLQNAEKMSEEELKQNQLLLDAHKILQENAVAAAKELDVAQQKTSELSKQARAESKRSGKASGAEYTKARKELKIQAEGYAKNQKAVDEFRKTLQSAGTDQSKLSKAVAEFRKSDAFKGASSELKSLVRAAQDGRISVEGLGDAVDKVEMAQDDAWVDSMDQFAESTGVSIQTADQLGGQLVTTAQREMQFSNATQAAEQNTNSLKERLKQAGVGTTDFARSLTACAQTISTVAMAGSALSGMWDTLTNPDASGMEKLTTVLMTLGMVIPMVTSAFNKQNLAQMATVISAIMAACGFNTESIAAIAAGTSTATFGTILWTVLWPIGLAMAAIAGLVGIVMLLVNVFKDMAANTPEGQLKAAEEEAKKTTEALNEAKEAADALRAAFDNYDSVVEELNNCTKGTEEWASALQAVNNEVLALLQEYPELSQYVTRNADGMLEISQSGRDYMQQMADQKVLNAQAANNQAQQNVRDKQINVQKSDIYDELYYNHWATDSQGYDKASDVANYINDNAADFAGMTDGEIKDALTEYFEANDIDVSQVDEWTEAVSEMKGDLQELAGAVEANTLATEMENQAMADNILAGNSKVQNSANAEEVMKASGDIYGAIYDDAYNEYLEKAQSRGWFNSKNENSEAMWKEYAKLQGIDEDSITNYKGSGKDASFVYEDENGEEVEVSAASVAAVVAAADANEKLAAAAENLVVKFAQLDASTDIADKALKDFLIDQNFEGATQAEFDAIREQLGGDNITDESIEKYLDDNFGDGKDGKISDETAQKYGYESAEAMVEAFSDGVKNYDTALEDVGKDLLTPVKQVFDSMDKSELSVKGQEAVAGLMEEAFNNGGQGGLDALKSIFANAGEDSEVLAGILNGIDWSAGDGLNQLNAALKAQEIELDTNSAEWQMYIATMENANYSAMSTFTTLRDGLTTLNSMKDAKVGDEIGLEKYEQLVTMFPELKNSLIQIDEETWQLTEDMESFLSSQENSLNSLIMKVNSYNEMVKSLTTVDEATDKSTLDTSGYNDLGKDSTASDYNAAFDALGADAAGSSMLASLGITQEYIDELVDAGNTEALAELKARIDEFLAGDYDTSGMQEQLAASAETIEELDEMVAEGALTNVEAYNKAWQKLHNSLDEDIDEDQYERLSEHIQDLADDSKDLSDELQNNEKVAKKVASSILRFDNAIEDVNENYEGWMEALESGDLEGVAEATEGLKDAYGDLLDIDGSSLSNDFLTNAENLKLMKEAAAGSEEAYKALQEAAAADILAHCEIENQAEFDAALATLEAEIDELNLSDIEIGAKIEDKEAIAAMENLINTAGMTAQQATDYLASMGVDAEVETVETEVEDKHEYDGAQATVNTEKVEGVDPITGNPITYNVPSISYEAVPLETESSKKETAFALKVTSATKSSGGGFKYKNSSNGGGTKGSGKGKSSSGGGDTKKAKTENKKSASGEKERYHVVENQLEDLEAQYDKIAKAKDRAFGKAKLKLMDEEIAKQKQIIAKQKEYLAQAEKNLKADKKKIKGYGAEFDENGTITNYEKLVESQVLKYNDAVEYYNSLSAEAQEKLDEEWSKKMNEDGEYYSGYVDAAGDAYDRFQDTLDQYEESQDLVRDKQQEIIDAQNELYDLQLEKIDYKVNLQIEFSDDELEHLEYLLERIEEKGFSAAEAIANLGQQTQSVMNKTGAYKEGVESILGNHGLSKKDVDAWLKGDKVASDKVAGLNLTESEVEKLREYTAGLRANNEALIELRQSVHDKMLETFDEWNEKIDRNINKLDHLKNMTESYRNIVDLVGKNNFAGGAETIAKLNESVVHQAGNYAQANIANRDRIAAQLQTTRDAYAKQKDTISEEERKMWEDTIKEMEDQLNEAEEAAMSSIEAWMEAINQQFIDSISATMDKFSSAVAGKFANLNELSEAFERQQTANDRYLESYEKIYEFSKLNRDIEKSIDNTSNIKAKKELANLQAEINELEESGAEVSEYQMENLRKRYELKLAELALEEAQNAKSEVRMTRDSEGNWGYVYTADETQVAEAEQSYEDKLYALQQQNGEYINQLQESIITMQQEMYDKMQEIANDESLSIEERQAKMAAVQQYYKNQMDYYCSELGLALNNNKTLYEDDWTEYSKATGYKMSSNDDYVDNFAETDLAILTGFTNMEDYQKAFNTASNTMLGENNEAFDKWQQTMEDGPLKSMGTSFETLSKDIDGHLGTIETESNETTKQITEDTKTSVDDYNGVVDAVIAWENQYSQSVNDMITESDNLIAKFNQVLALWAEVKAAAEAEVPEPPSSGGGGDDSGGGNGDGESGGGGKPSWDRVVAAYNKINGGKWGNGIQSRISKGKADGFTEDEVRAGQQLINYTYPPNLNGMGYSREKAKGLMGYDTGGYTGAWGDNSGRLALLHQKELVLNQEDTANMLSAIDMIRQISSMIDLNAMSSMKGLGGILSAGGVGGNPGTFEQHVEIHASFPDATDHSEIEEAFNNLLNSASQYANRKL